MSAETKFRCSSCACIWQTYATRYAPQDGGCSRQEDIEALAGFLEGVNVVDDEYISEIGITTDCPLWVKNSNG